MSIDVSLKFKGGMSSHRNVLTRAERIVRLQKAAQFDAKKDSALGLRKVANRKLK